MNRPEAPTTYIIRKSTLGWNICFARVTEPGGYGFSQTGIPTFRAAVARARHFAKGEGDAIYARPSLRSRGNSWHSIGVQS